MFEFTIEATSSAARTGTLVLPHGTIETPAFMPVGTQGTVRTLSPADLKSGGARGGGWGDRQGRLERTLRWLERCAARHRELADGRQTLWPILQGGTHLGLREEGLRRIGDLASWTGLAIGGLSVGEPKPVMY